MVHGAEPGEWLEAGAETPADAQFDPSAVLAGLGCDYDEIEAAYYFLVERGLDREPQDGLTMLRRARPRAYHIRWRGMPRRAQDHFDAAELIRRFLTELKGEPPGMPSVWPMDGRQPEREALYGHGPAAPFDPEEMRNELASVELYPNAAQVLGEGESEQIVVERLVGAVMGRVGLERMDFFDLGGSGAAKHVTPLANSFGSYALRVLLIVDQEGQMAEYVGTAVERGELDAEDVLMFKDSFEEDNATPEELIELAAEIGRNPSPGTEPVELRLDVETLKKVHAERLERLPPSGDRPGLVDTLIRLAGQEEHGPLRLDKLAIAEALASMFVAELHAAWEQTEGREERMAELLKRRPVVKFILERLVPALDHPRPVGANI